METKEFKVHIPEGYEIDRENSTFECIKFKYLNRNITYNDICNTLFADKDGFFITTNGNITDNIFSWDSAIEKNNATNKEQLERLLALNQLLNIVTYYNSKVEEPDDLYINDLYTIVYNVFYKSYTVSIIGSTITSVRPVFKSKEDAQAVWWFEFEDY